MNSNTKPAHKFTFPPFPTVPLGVTIMSFKQFKQRGIRMEPPAGTDPSKDTDIEVDALGIPTVVVGKKPHDNDECKTNTRRKRKRHAGEKARWEEKPKGKEWWELWEEEEERRRGRGVDVTASRTDRLYQATTDFKSGRPWPQSQKLVGIPEIWDQFRRYIGIPDNAPQTSTKAKAKAPAIDEDDEDDDDEYGGGSGDYVSDDEGFDGPRVSGEGVKDAPDEAEGTGIIDPKQILDEDRREKEERRKEKRLQHFLDDPERSVKVYLSSYCRAKGYIWAESNLLNIPRIVSFFLAFLVRGSFFPESEAKLKLARDVVEHAKKELPATGKVAQAWPDAVSSACVECWGGKGVGYQRVGGEGWNVGGKKDEDEGKKKEEERREKRQKVDAETGWGGKEDDALSGWGTTDSASTGWGGKGDSAPATPMDVDTPPTPQIREFEVGDISALSRDPITLATMNSGWGAVPYSDNNTTQGGWGTSGDVPKPDIKAIDIDPKDAVNPWADPTAESWGVFTPASLLPLLGPTALPLTHTAGVVETSMRRVKKIEKPLLPTAEVSPPSDDPSAEAVEVELGRRFAKIVLSPWLEWDEAGDVVPHLSRPKIMDTSKGVVVDPAAPASNATPLTLAVKPHDPMKDDIILLVEPGAVDFLSEGMGFAGTWVQIARVSDLEGGVAGDGGAAPAGEVGKEKTWKQKKKRDVEAKEATTAEVKMSEPETKNDKEPEAMVEDKRDTDTKEGTEPDSKQGGEEEKKKKKKKKAKSSKTALTRYWYLDEMTMIIPSFWTV